MKAKAGGYLWLASLALVAGTVLGDVAGPTNAPPSTPALEPVADTNAVPAVPGHPFAIIPVRNAFNIHPPPPPPEPQVEAPPPVEKLNVSLTGIGVRNGKKEAYFVVLTKDASKGPSYVTVSEGDAAPDGFDLKVLEVREDDDTPTVKVKNTGEEVVMNMKDNGFKGGPQAPGNPPPGVPGVFPGNIPPRVVPLPGAQPLAAGGGGGPTIIGRGGQQYGGGDNPGLGGLNPVGNVSPNNLLLNGNNGVIGGSGGAVPTTIPTRQTPNYTGGPSVNPRARNSSVPPPPPPGE